MLRKTGVVLAAMLSVTIFNRAAAQQVQSVPDNLKSYDCQKSEVGKGAPLDLTGSKVTFEDEFDKPDITAIGGGGKWYAPVHGDFGGARFLPYRADQGPFLFSNGQLTIQLGKIGGRWTSGIMQTVDKAGRGFSQRYGYFEMRAKLPSGQGTWPAFWLKTPNEFTDPTETRTEIDILEAYGDKDVQGYHSSVHLWPARQLQPDATIVKHWSKSCYRKIPSGLFDGNFHTYGARVTSQWIIVYFDRKEILRFPSLPEFRRPLFVLVDLAYDQKQERTTDAPSDMVVDYVRVWDK